MVTFRDRLIYLYKTGVSYLGLNLVLNCLLVGGR